jgi:hypothetical protein
MQAEPNLPQPEQGLEGFTNAFVEPTALPRAEETPFLPLQQSYLWVILSGRAIFAGVVFVGILFWLSFGGHWLEFKTVGLVFLGYIVWVVLMMTLSYLGYKRKGYSLREKDIMYRSGLIWKRWLALPFNRVQHCEIKESPLEDIFDVCRLKVYTAGGSGSDMTIPGLKKEQARRLKAYILGKSAVDEEE